MKRKESNKKLQYSHLNAVDFGIALWTYYELNLHLQQRLKRCDYKRYCNEKNSENLGVTAFK